LRIPSKLVGLLEHPHRLADRESAAVALKGAETLIWSRGAEVVSRRGGRTRRIGALFFSLVYLALLMVSWVDR